MQIAAHGLSWALQNRTAYFDNQKNCQTVAKETKGFFVQSIALRRIKKGRGIVSVLEV